jgi:hypothetical protein
MIENMIFHNILRRLVQSNIIVDANDPSEVIGNTLNETISYFNNDIHKAKVSEFEVRLKSIPK